MLIPWKNQHNTTIANTIKNMVNIVYNPQTKHKIQRTSAKPKTATNTHLNVCLWHLVKKHCFAAKKKAQEGFSCLVWPKNDGCCCCFWFFCAICFCWFVCFWL